MTRLSGTQLVSNAMGERHHGDGQRLFMPFGQAEVFAGSQSKRSNIQARKTTPP
jgi:hypothetical protein